MSNILVEKKCNTMQEVMTYASAATILSLGFDMSLVNIKDGEEIQPMFVISVYDEMGTKEGEICDPDCDCNSDVTDQFEVGTDYGAGTYL